MTLRTRFTLWYATVLAASLVLFSGLLYHEWVIEPQRAALTHVAEDESTGDLLLEGLFWCWIPAVVLGIGGGWWLMRRAFEPVAALTAAAERINESTLGEQLPRTGNGDELDRMTEVFNRMTARLADSFQRVREFTLHASHELKTPLTIMRSGIETTLREQPVSAAQRESLEGQLDEIVRLAKIVDSLTLLTKADAGLIVFEREPVALEELLTDAADDAEALAPPGVHVRIGVCEPVTFSGDRHRLRQLLLNLTDNAVKYNEPNGEVLLTLRRDGAVAELVITNTGPAIPAEIQPRLFEPFFRADPSHNSAVEGTGLGLAIARWIVTAHGGTIALDSQPGTPIAVTVRLPLTRQAF